MLLESLSRNDLKFNDMLKGSVNEISGHTPIYKMACPIHNGILKSFV